jgi:hypothetical protein
VEERDLYWLAGLIEGEGCIRAAGRRKVYTLLTIRMGDEDVLRKVQRIAGGTINGPYGPDPSHPNNSPMWHWYIGGPGARELVKKLWRLMGRRRRRKINEVLAAWASRTNARRTNDEES